ncbi:MAG: hypothetical protein K6C98_01395 [Treponema sp.]|nr:hypothetical protein [Treponema sp.]
MKRLFLSTIVAAMIFSASAQSAQKVTELLSVERITYADASYFIAIQSGLASDDISEAEAFDILKENKFIKNKNVQSSDEIKIKDMSFLCVKAAEIKGGLLFRITKAPRYALRELKAMNIVPNDTDPAAFVSGKEFINILSECDSKKGGF